MRSCSSRASCCGDLGPGDPWLIARLLRAAGTDPPPIGDTGRQARSIPMRRRRGARSMDPNDPMLRLRNYQNFRNEMRRPQEPRFGPNGNASDEEIYDRAIVARAYSRRLTRSDDGGDRRASGDDVHSAKELVAEEIANSILH